MKKQIIISSLIAVAILGGTTVAVLNDARAKKPQDDSLVALASNLTPTQLSTSKNETVYVITDATGSAKTKFIGNTIYNGTEELPFNFKITYYLDGQEISSQDLKGKSGHVKIIYSYDSTAKYLGRNIPFVALTGLTLDRANFSNVKLENGKIITETDDSYILTGYAVTGLNANLGTDLLPESFTIEADAKDFKLKDSYTIFTNEILADIDTSKLNDLDSLTNSIYQLSDALDQIIAGSTELSNGLSTALDGTKTLHSGAETLANGLLELESHNEEIVAGAKQIASLAPSIAELMQEKIDSLSEKKTDLEATKLDLENRLLNIPDLPPYAETRAIITENINQIAAGLEQIDAGITTLRAGLSKLPALATLYDGLVDYTDGVAKAATGAAAISDGLGSLVDGTTKLYEGSVTLNNGLITFKSSGIDKLVDFASKDLNNFIINLRGSVNAASSYHTFGNTDSRNVKFIVKTPSI